MTLCRLIILLLTPWIGGCAATTFVTPELKLGSALVVSTAVILPADATLDQTAGETSPREIALGLRSTFRF